MWKTAKRIKKSIIGLLVSLSIGYVTVGKADAQVKKSVKRRNATVNLAAESGTIFSFPGRAEDLGGGEYWYRRKKIHGSGSQKLGYDLSAIRFDSKRKLWTRLRVGVDPDAYEKNKRNQDWIIYGKPVYAMSDGTIVACWRNAPENPAPGESHPGRLSEPKTIGGGGNFVKVDIGNGEEILYAHMKPGTVPKELCPFNAKFRKDASDPAASTIPVGKRPKIKAGRFLGRVGNSGKSGNPHLHVHRSKNGKPLTLRFDRFQFKPAESASDASSKWTTRTGSTLPPGKVAVLPNYGPGHKEIARHGLPSSSYQHVFDHITGSGYRLEWVNGFHAGGTLRFNVVYRPKDGAPWAAFHNLDGGQYQKKFDEYTKKGFALYHVDSYLAGKNVRYAAIFRKAKGHFVAYHGVSAEQHQKKFDALTKKGYRAKNLSVVAPGGKRFYTALYVKSGNGSWLARSFLTPAEYQKEFDANAKRGRTLDYLDVYLYKGETRFSAIWSAPSKPHRARHGLTSAQYQKEWESALGNGFVTRAVAGVASGKSARYAAVWSK